MSYKEVKNILTELSAEQKEFLKTKQYEGRMNMKQWLELIHKMVILDTKGDKARGRALTFWILSLILTIIGFIVVAASEITYLLFIPAVFLALFVYFLVVFFNLKKIDLTNQLREQVYPFLAAIRDDIPRKAKITLKMNFSEAVQKKHVTEIIPPQGRRLPRIKTTFYTLPYFSSIFNMTDGAEVNFEASDIVRKRDITKRGSSGKIKSKVKYKTKHLFSLKIAYPKEKYNFVGGGNVLYNDTGSHHQLRLKNKVTSLGKGSIQTPDVLLSTFAAAYQNVKPV